MKLEHITKTYKINTQSPFVALDDINLSFKETGLVFIVGKSGSGKSTLLHIMGGMDKPTKGSMFFGNHEVSKLSNAGLNRYRNEVVGFVFQDSHLIDSISVYANLRLTLSLKEKPNRVLIETVLKEVGLEGFSNRITNTLSGGERQRVAIARAILKKPKVLLADEPTGALDSTTSEEIYQLLEKLSKSYLVVCITHDQSASSKYGHRVIELKDGRIIKDSNPHDAPSTTNIELKKPRLNITESFLLGFRSVKKVSFRLALTIIISTLLLLIIGITDALSNYDKYEQASDSLKESKAPYIKLVKNNKDTSLLSESDVSEYHLKYENEMYPVRLGFEKALDAFVYDAIPDSDLYPYSINGAVAVNKEAESMLNIHLLHGKMPVKSDEIAITNRIFNILKSYGFNDEGQRVEISNYESIIGKTIDFDESGNYEIVGIYDTFFDFNKYDNLLKKHMSGFFQSIISTELSDMNNSIHNMVFISQSNEDEMKAIMNTKYFEPNLYESGALGLSNSEYHFEITKIVSFIPEEYAVIWINETANLNENQVLLNNFLLSDYYDSSDIFSLMDSLIESFVEKHFHEIEDTFNEPEYESYFEYINYASENKYHPGFDSRYFYGKAYKTIISNILNEINHSFCMDLNGTERCYEIAGFFIDNNSDKFNNVIFSSAGYNNLISTGVVKTYDSLIMRYNVTDSMLLKDIFSSGEARMDGYNDIISNVNYIEYIRGLTQIPLSIVSGFVLVLAVIIIFYYILTTIQSEGKIIGILRSLGASYKHIYLWFTTEIMILLYSSLIASSLLLKLSSLVINRIVKDAIYVKVDIIMIMPRQYILLALITTLLGVLSTILPVYKYVKRNPLDSINSESL